jgi:hypothetical protein
MPRAEWAFVSIVRIGQMSFVTHSGRQSAVAAFG